MRSVRHAGLLVGVWGVLTVGTPQRAVQQDGQPPVISVETNLVTLSVTVVDRHGAFVPGLTSDNFQVYDNGEKQAIQFFTNEEIPATVGLVIDSSGSMRERRDEVTAAASAFVAVRHSLDETFTINFNEAVWPGLPPGVAFAENPEQLRRALARAPAIGMTAVYDAVDVALDHVQLGTRDRKVLILVSDGGDNASSQTLERVIEHARRADAVIYGVMLVDPDNREARPAVLKSLARETGGSVFAPLTAQQVLEAFTRIAHEISSGYTIGYSAPEAPNDGYRTIRVVADAGDRRALSVRTRAGYYAGRPDHDAK